MPFTLATWNINSVRLREGLVAKLMELHRALLTNSQNAELLLSQGLAEITRVAAVRNKG